MKTFLPSLILVLFTLGVNAQSDTLRYPKWISVNDSLPSIPGKYLVYIHRCDANHKNDCSAFMQAVFYEKADIDKASHWFTWYMQFDEYTKYTVKVTHWMPLPPKP